MFDRESPAESLTPCASTRAFHRASRGLLLVVTAVAFTACARQARVDARAERSDASGTAVADEPKQLVAEGQRVFRFETFGNEVYWTDTARMHEVVRDGVSPSAALALGLKVDSEALPAALADSIRLGKVDLDAPATTLALLELDAVVGLKGTVETHDGEPTLVSLGITCALCHSTVDESFAPGIGRRQDGWANRDLDVGAIIALSPALTPEQVAVYSSWGPGKYDPRYNIDGENTPVVIPPIYGLADVANVTYTGDGSLAYWNAYVAITQMHGLGDFVEPLLAIEVEHTPDLVNPLLAALGAYQLGLETPTQALASESAEAVRRGQVVFVANCASCHVDATGTDNVDGLLHGADETGMDPRYAARSVNRRYRTTPLRGLWQHPPYFHDGSAATLADVVEHYDKVRGLELEAPAKRDLVAYLGTL